MACILPNMNAEKEALLSEAIVHAQQQNEKTILDLKTKIQIDSQHYIQKQK
jgi:hypothetical protein